MEDKPKVHKPLTAVQVEKAKPGDKPRKMFDERGLYLLIQPNGGRWWRFRYRFAGKELLMSLGTYPDVSLARARKRRDAARELLAEGIDPAAQRKAEKEASGATFEAVALDWFEKFKVQWTAGTGKKILDRMKKHLFPPLGKKVVREITAPDLLAVLEKIKARGRHETARRMRQIFGQVARYAVRSGKADHDVSAALKGALADVQVVHRAAIVDPKKVGALLRVLDGYDGSLIVKCALRLAPLTFVRPGELRKAEWSEIDLDAATWTIPAWKMKMRSSLTVPLASQAVAILRELHRVTGDGKYVFPSARTTARPMSDNAVLAALRRSGIPGDEMTGHGFRAMARTILDEVLGFRVDIVEHQLGHAVKDPNGRAYNRTSFLPERTKMMQAWADYLAELKAGTSAVKGASA